jgi:hypothetical protein
LVIKPECFLCFLMFEIRVTSICLQPENADQADQPCILHIPGIHRITRKKKATLTFSISILHLLTFSSLVLLSHQCKGPEKKFLQKLRPGEDSNQERATRLTST